MSRRSPIIKTSLVACPVMVFSLHRLFAPLGALPLIGPHGGHEAELLLIGAKRMGLLCISHAAEQYLSDHEKHEREEVAHLDRAVEARILSKIAVPIPHPDDEPDRTAYFYCQKGLESELRELAESHRTAWQGGGETDLPHEIGWYFGYTDADVRLFNSGGYESLPPVARQFMIHTHSWRKAARLASLRHAAPRAPRSTEQRAP